ncbi:MAG: hypothetical protein PHV60_00940 [bacterium]|nr:hypothetical protein [bacterium]
MATNTMIKYSWLLFLYCLLSGTIGQAEDLVNYLPQNTEIVFNLRDLDSSNAWRSMIKTYREKITRHQDDPNYLIISYLFKQFTFKQIAGGSFPAAVGWGNVLVVFPELEGEKERFNKFLIDNLGNFVSVSPRWKKVENIYFDSESENNDRLTAFSVRDNRVILASNSRLVSKCLEAKQKGISIITSASYQEMSSRLPQDYDGYIFINNKSRRFTQELKKWEKENKLVAMMSSQWLESLLLTFSLVTEDKLKGKLIFKCSDPAKVKLMQNDAQFLGEVIKRKYAYSQLVYDHKVEVQGNTVILDFDASNFKAILDKEL